MLSPDDSDPGSPGTKGGWRIHEITNLHHEPYGVTQDGDRFLFAGDRFVSTLETNGRQRELYNAEQRLGIRSLVRLANGDIWAGASAALLRLRSKSDAAYAAQWFAPLAAKTPRPGQ
ncbi:hypothetical protein EON77_14905 [bacterium]|nr:MAG: hypothetical protein EON77_14905 [bacterium]